MNQFTWLTWQFDEFGFKTRWLICDENILIAFRDYLMLQNKFSYWNYIKMLAQYGIIEVLDIMDSVVVEFMDRYC